MQADSLVQLLNTLQTAGTIQLTYDPSIQPHGISRMDVFDPDAFRRCSETGTSSWNFVFQTPFAFLLIPPPSHFHTQHANNTTLRHGSARLRWFQRVDITGSSGQPEQLSSSRELENGVNQAFRRCRPIPRL